MTHQDYQKILESHNAFFHTGATKNIDFRLEQLRKLRDAMQSYEARLLEALWDDLHKSEYEAFATEIGILYASLQLTLKKLNKWSKPERAGTPLMFFGSRNRIYHEPYGTVLIIGPFNYPVNLIFEPLIGAIAAGNCAVTKTSELTPAVSAILADLVRTTFPKEYISIVEGGKEETTQLLALPFDYIFFTGGGNVGKIVMKAASENLIPVTLELGGKSPCIVDETADLDLAARKITWGKFTNAGQTCIAPDYLVIHKAVKSTLLEKITVQIQRFYGDDPKQSSDFGRIVNIPHTERLARFLESGTVLTGGTTDVENRYIAPTLLETSWDTPVMQDEIFGPILPLLEYSELDNVIQNIRNRPKPLALYVFTRNRQTSRKVLDTVSFGGGCVNDVMLHAGNPNLPFGGVGPSGIGAYHGKKSFETFSHEKGVLDRVIKFDPDIMYPPYTGSKLSMIKRFLK